MANDKSFAAKYKGRKIPMETLVEAYMNGKVDFKGDPLTAMWQRNLYATFNITFGHLKFFLTKFVGQLVHHSQKADTAEVRDVYDRGNDFYNWFLGPRMVYTCGLYTSTDDTLEEAQDRKMSTILKKIHVKEGDRHLDIGCGWGTLLAHAAKYFKTESSTGVTLAREQKEWGLKTAKSTVLRIKSTFSVWTTVTFQREKSLTR